MTYKVLVLDIDGTVTNSKKELTSSTREALIDIQKQGCIVVLASGRPTAGILTLAKELELEQFGGYILSFNGAKVIACQTGETIFQQVLPKDSIKKLYDASKQYSVGIVSYEGDVVITESDIDEYMIKEANLNKISIQKVDNFVEYITFDVNKCLMTASGDYLATVEPLMKEQFGTYLNIYRSEPYFLEIMPQEIDKAYSLSKLLEYIDATKEEMICCGDGFNDLTMIQYAGLGVAMANAQEVVRNAADFVTLSNDEDGIVHVIQKFLTI